MSNCPGPQLGGVDGWTYTYVARNCSVHDVTSLLMLLLVVVVVRLMRQLLVGDVFHADACMCVCVCAFVCSRFICDIRHHTGDSMTLMLTDFAIHYSVAFSLYTCLSVWCLNKELQKSKLLFIITAYSSAAYGCWWHVEIVMYFMWKSRRDDAGSVITFLEIVVKPVNGCATTESPWFLSEPCKMWYTIFLNGFGVSRGICKKSKPQTILGGSVAEWLACWTQARKGMGSNRSRDAVG